MSLTNIMSESLSYNYEAKNAFHRLGKKTLLAVAKSMGLKRGEFDLRNNKGGIAVSGEVTLHTDKAYIQLSQPCYGKDNEVLYRTCEGRKDYTGGMNNFSSVAELEDVDMFTARVLILIN